VKLITENTKLTSQEWQIHLTGELLMFSLLGKVLLQIPEKSWLQPLLDEDLFAEAPFAEKQTKVIHGLVLLEKWSRDFQGNIPQAALTDLKADYTRLFTGMAKIPVAPWESVYFTEERLVFQAQTQDVRNWYRRYGLELDNQYKEPEDHIGLELTFMGHLAKIGLSALAAHNQADFEQALAAQRDFAAKHLFLWAPLWCNLVNEHAQTVFYRGLALVVHGALIELAAILNLCIPQRSQS
jgi:putative dimethyl sulfoxide reductase chaperone